MSQVDKLTVRRQTTPRVKRTPARLAELRAVRERFQREKPTLEAILAATGQDEPTTLGEYLQTRELLRALARERERQRVTLAQLAERTGYDPAVLSRLFTGRQVNPTLATVGRIANALGKVVVHTLQDLSPAPRNHSVRPDATVFRTAAKKPAVKSAAKKARRADGAPEGRG
jgi:transcriptional regulator with XRE-family HTH domain